MSPQFIDSWRVLELLRYLNQQGVMSAATSSSSGGGFLGLRNALRLSHLRRPA